MTDELAADVVVVGAGRAGTAAAYRLAQLDFDVVLLDQASQPGMKNVTGGVLYGDVLDDLVPEFPAEAPLERHVVEHNIRLLNDGSQVGVSYRDESLLAEPNYTVVLGKFDPWFVERSEAEGAVYVPETTVTDVRQTADGAVVETDRADGTIRCRAVIGADGVNSTVGQTTGIRRPLRNEDVALSVKQVIDLDPAIIEERFNLDQSEGAAYVFTGYPEGVPSVGYFIYTFDDMISVGAVGGMEQLRWLGDEGYGGSGTPLYGLLEEFKELPAVRPLVGGDVLREYQGTLVPEVGYGELPDRHASRVALVGDAACLVLNKGYTFRGLDYGVKSGVLAAEAAEACRNDGNWNAFGERYDRRLEDSYVMQEMRQHSRLPSFLENGRLYGTYPEIATATLEAMYSSRTDATGLTWRQAYRAFRASDAGLFDLARDGWRAFRSM